MDDKSVTTFDFTQVLPAEITEKILHLLNAYELSTFQLVCVKWREIANTDYLWIHFCISRGWLKYGVSFDILKEESWNPNPFSNSSSSSPLFVLNVPGNTRLSPICKWKHVFIRMEHLNLNWRKGRYTVVAALKSHTDKVTAFDCQDNCLVSGSNDRTVCIWDLRTCKCIRKVEGYSNTITAVKILGSLAVFGLGDGCIHVINTTTGDHELTFLGHSDCISHISVDHYFVISASSDCTVKVWSLISKELMHTMTLHTDEIECMFSYGNHVATGSWDRTLILWCVETGVCVHQYVGHNEVVSCCQFDSTKIVSGSYDGDVRIWSCQSGHCIHLLSGHRGEVYCVVYNDYCIASGSSDSTIILWSHLGILLHTLSEHMGIVRCLHINEERLVSGGDQRMIIVWDFKSGKKLAVLHRNPTKLHLMWVGETKLITASPEKSGTMTLLSFW
ncbi:F-box and WD repeat domain-containing 11-B-like [Physella acuta]|uniref:F-box and WD repeat domain-containing 11-B-like n=1 Tax=Physella acuta TaxID=109671 RepID=UPI0027DDFE5C|nr:F-box and WD repeat domain-containing 11-B-like [Physella acuta]